MIRLVNLVAFTLWGTLFTIFLYCQRSKVLLQETELRGGVLITIVGLKLEELLTGDMER
jgi:hypothetical protein